MYVSTLTSEIMDSMVAVEGAVEGALERQTTFRTSLHWRKKTAVYQRCAAPNRIHCEHGGRAWGCPRAIGRPPATVSPAEALSRTALAPGQDVRRSR